MRSGRWAPASTRCVASVGHLPVAFATVAAAPGAPAFRIARGREKRVSACRMTWLDAWLAVTGSRRRRRYAATAYRFSARAGDVAERSTAQAMMCCLGAGRSGRNVRSVSPDKTYAPEQGTGCPYSYQKAALVVSLHQYSFSIWRCSNVNTDVTTHPLPSH